MRKWHFLHVTNEYYFYAARTGHWFLTIHIAPHLISQHPCMHTVSSSSTVLLLCHSPSKGKELCSLSFTSSTLRMVLILVCVTRQQRHLSSKSSCHSVLVAISQKKGIQLRDTKANEKCPNPCPCLRHHPP